MKRSKNAYLVEITYADRKELFVEELEGDELISYVFSQLERLLMDKKVEGISLRLKDDVK